MKNKKKVLKDTERRVDRTSRSGLRPAVATPYTQVVSLHDQMGNRAVGQLIQTKLTIGAPDDKYEQEADRIADQVMRMPEQPMQREVALEDEKGEELLQTKPLASQITPLVRRQAEGEGQTTVDTSSVEGVLHSPGQPLDEATRALMESRFGYDLGGVRVHTDPVAAESARSVNARAYTVGHNIVFGTDQYIPGTSVGQRLLAHELTHVVQQLGADGTHFGQGNEKRNFSLIPSGIDLQRVDWEDLDIIGGGLELLAKLNFSIPLCKILIDHYCHGNGAQLWLMELGMIQCNALIDFANDKRSPEFLSFVNQMGAEIARNAGGDPKRLTDSIESDVSFDMLGLCNTSGTLGDFTVYAWGKLKVWNPNADGTDADWAFDGHMWWYDRWDFNKRTASAKGEPGRTNKGSWRTKAGRLLVGTPFDIKSEAVPVRQVRAEAKGTNHYAKWKGNPEGKRLPVISGIL